MNVWPSSRGALTDRLRGKKGFTASERCQRVVVLEVVVGECTNSDRQDV